MNILQFMLANWDSVLIVLLVATAIIFIIAKKQWALLDKILFALVTWAEREYGGGTGSLKLAAVVEKIYSHIPAVIRFFISTDYLVKLIEQALEKAKEVWGRNPILLTTPQ